MPYRMKDDSVTLPGKGRPDFSGQSVTARGEEQRLRKGPEPGRFDVGSRKHPERLEGVSTARDVTSVHPEDPITKRMPNLR
jgi:hypothetical protein